MTLPSHCSAQLTDARMHRCTAADDIVHGPCEMQERLSFQHLIHRRFPGETVCVTVLRRGEQLDVSVPVQPLRRLVPATVYDEAQPYFLYGGFAFVGLTEPYLHEWGDDWKQDAPQDLVHLTLTGIQRLRDEQPVILSRIFPSRHTAGYSNMADRQVVSVNDHPVLNLQQMYSLVQTLHETEDSMAFELFCTGGNAAVTTSTDAAAEARSPLAPRPPADMCPRAEMRWRWRAGANQLCSRQRGASGPATLSFSHARLYARSCPLLRRRPSRRRSACIEYQSRRLRSWCRRTRRTQRPYRRGCSKVHTSDFCTGRSHLLMPRPV